MNKISGLAQGAVTALKSAGKGAGEGSGAFKDLMTNLMESAKSDAMKIEKSTKSQVMGETDFTKLTTNITQLETMVQGMTGIRDKLVGALNDLLKLQI